MEHEVMALVQKFITINPFIAYIFFSLNSMLQILFPPYPGDSIIVLSGYLSSTGVINTPLVLLITLVSTISSSIFLYIISFKFSNKILTNKYICKFFDIKKVYSLENWFKKYGVLAIIINRFLPGISSLTLIAAGIFKLPLRPAVISIAFASIIHNLSLFIVGRVTGNNINLIKSTIAKYNKLFMLILLLFLLIYAFIKFLQFKSNKKNK